MPCTHIRSVRILGPIGPVRVVQGGDDLPCDDCDRWLGEPMSTAEIEGAQ
jgi:hypothetical protein